MNNTIFLPFILKELRHEIITIQRVETPTKLSKTKIIGQNVKTRY